MKECKLLYIGIGLLIGYYLANPQQATDQAGRLYTTAKSQLDLNRIQNRPPKIGLIGRYGSKSKSV